jgi:glycerol-3-phosphate acyltransferase PlsY
MYLISALIGYLFGSIPSAYIIVKLKTGEKITDIGSGNVGTTNTLRVTKSKIATVIVLILDITKGILAVLLVQNFFDFNSSYITGIFSVLGHNYSVWLKFKGGRGIATSLGVVAIFEPIILLLVFAVYGVVYVITKKTVYGTVVTVLVLPIFVLFLKFSENFLIFLSVICFLILMGHFKKFISTLKGESINAEKNNS